MFEIVMMSKVPTTVVIENVKTNILPYSSKKLELSDTKNFCFDYYFSNSSSHIFHANATFLDDQFFVDDKNLKVVKVNQSKIILKFCRQNQCFLQKKCAKIKKNGVIFNFYQNGLVEIESEEAVCFCEEFDFEILEAEIFELKNNFFAIKLFGKNQAEKSVIFNSFYRPLLSFDSCVLERTENGFKVLTNVMDIARHGIVEIFDIDEDVTKVDEYTVFMNQYPYSEINVMVLPIYFLQCIKSGDFAEAKKCLTQKLKSKVKIDHLKQYFGDILDVIVLGDEIFVETVDAKGEHIAKKYNFSLEENKIGNIS